MIMLNEFGDRLSFGGIACPFYSPSEPLAEHDGRREVCRGVAFNRLLTEHGGDRLPIAIHALDHRGVFTVCDQTNASIRLWVEAGTGLMFEVTDMQATDDARWAVNQMARGTFTKCSIGDADMVHRKTPRNDGAVVLERVERIGHIALLSVDDGPAYPATHCALLGATFPSTWQAMTQAAWEASRLKAFSWVPRIQAKPAPRPVAKPKAPAKPKARAKAMTAPRVDVAAAERNLDLVLAEMRRRA